MRVMIGTNVRSMPTPAMRPSTSRPSTNVPPRPTFAFVPEGRARWTMLAPWLAGWVALALLCVFGVPTLRIALDAVHGRGDRGTLTLCCEVEHSSGRSSYWTWRGRFRSADGRIETDAVLAEQLPGQDDPD